MVLLDTSVSWTTCLPRVKLITGNAVYPPLFTVLSNSWPSEGRWFSSAGSQPSWYSRTVLCRCGSKSTQQRKATNPGSLLTKQLSGLKAQQIHHVLLQFCLNLDFVTMIKEPTIKQCQSNGNRNMASFGHSNPGVDATLRSQKYTTVPVCSIHACIYIVATCFDDCQLMVTIWIKEQQKVIFI
jgi:hypothetical protein